MKTRCPSCETLYDIEPDALREADGMARCYHCGTVFDAATQQTATDAPPQPEAPDTALPMNEDIGVSDDADGKVHELPFAMPDNLKPLEASPDAALDVADMLYVKKSYRMLIYGWLIALLMAGLGLQLAWQHRERLLADYPFLAPVCEHLPCVASVTHEPERFRVVQREMKPAPNEPGALTLTASIRNDADAAQSLPDIQLSLLDNNGGVMIRRRLTPQAYLFPSPEPGRLMQPGEVITIGIDFKDPGQQATGFMIDFL